jgi:hypothetical protein
MTSLGLATNVAVTNFNAITEKLVDTSPITTVTYYSGDQIGSWPLWLGR